MRNYISPGISAQTTVKHTNGNALPTRQIIKLEVNKNRLNLFLIFWLI